MFKFSLPFSEKYTKEAEFRDKIRALVLMAKSKYKSATLFGKKIDVNNPEDLVAALFLMSEDFEVFGEPLF